MKLNMLMQHQILKDQAKQMVNEEARKALSNINDATSNDLVNQAKDEGQSAIEHIHADELPKSKTRC